ncbi:MAG: hypothetical protein ACFCU1_05605 [Sumerlaeia bacterium]
MVIPNPDHHLPAVEQRPLLASQTAGPILPPKTITAQQFFYRLGLLACAVVFLLEGVDLKLQAGLLLFGLWLCNSLALLMLLLGWKVLGDWRSPLNQTLVGLTSVVMPLYSYLVFVPSPKQEENLALITQAVGNARTFLEVVPGGMFIGATIQLLVFFVLLIIVLIITTSQSELFQRTATTLLYAGQAIALLVIYQNVEVVLSIFFFLYFLKSVWEKPLILSQSLEWHLNALQLSYLRELLNEGSLSTGQTKVYLRQQAPLFAELLEHQLVEVDSIAREILPGKRLNNHSAVQIYKSAKSMMRRGIWIVFGLLYLVLPDLLPFTFIDDIIVLLIVSGIGIDWKSLFQKRREPRP